MKNGKQIAWVLPLLLLGASAYAAVEPTTGSQEARFNFVPEFTRNGQNWSAAMSDAFTLDFTRKIGQNISKWSFDLLPVAQGNIGEENFIGLAQVGNNIIALLTQPFTENNHTNDLMVFVKLNPATGDFKYFRRGLIGRIQGNMVFAVTPENSFSVIYKIKEYDNTIRAKRMFFNQELDLIKSQDEAAATPTAQPVSGVVVYNTQNWQLFHLKDQDLAFGRHTPEGTVVFSPAPLNQLAKGADRNLTVRLFAPMHDGLLAILTQPNPEDVNQDVIILVKLTVATNHIYHLRSIIQGKIVGNIAVQEYADNSLSVIYQVNCKGKLVTVRDNVSPTFQYVD